MRAWNIIPFLISFLPILHAQQAKPPAIEWMREYEGLANAYASQVLSTSDGGFLLTGNTASPVQGPWAFDTLYLAKADGDGNISWEKGINESNWAVVLRLICTRSERRRVPGGGSNRFL